MMWLVLGAEGLLGRAVVSALDVTGEDCHGLTRRDFDFAGDVDWARFAELVAGSDVVVNCAGYSDVDGAELEQELASCLNTELPEQLAEICWH